MLLSGSFGWGLFVRSRRQLIASLRERADRAHAEARRQAREDIAREMHDVLAHRLSLLSVHAGALRFNPGAPEEEIQRTAGVIRDCAHEALEDLREIIGVLRASSGEGCPAAARAGGPGAAGGGVPHGGDAGELDVRIAGASLGDLQVQFHPHPRRTGLLRQRQQVR